MSVTARRQRSRKTVPPLFLHSPEDKTEVRCFGGEQSPEGRRKQLRRSYLERERRWIECLWWGAR